MSDYSKILEAAKNGAEKYFPVQMDYLKRFSSIDCGTGNEKGNSEIVSILKELLLSMGADVGIHYEKGLGSHITARITPENPAGKIVLNAHIDTVLAKALHKTTHSILTATGLTALELPTAKAASSFQYLR